MTFDRWSRGERDGKKKKVRRSPLLFNGAAEICSRQTGFWRSKTTYIYIYKHIELFHIHRELKRTLEGRSRSTAYGFAFEFYAESWTREQKRIKKKGPRRFFGSFSRLYMYVCLHKGRTILVTYVCFTTHCILCSMFYRCCTIQNLYIYINTGPLGTVRLSLVIPWRQCYPRNFLTSP